LRRLHDILVDERDRLFRFVRALVGDISAQRLGEFATIIGKYLRFPLATRDCNIGHAVVEQIFGTEFRVNMNENAVGGLTLARIAGDGNAP
jgi:hypothetical protein